MTCMRRLWCLHRSARAQLWVCLMVIDTLISNHSHLESMSATEWNIKLGSETDGTRVTGWEFNRSRAQQWKLEKVNPGAPWSPWTLRNVCGGSESSLFLDESFDCLSLILLFCVGYLDLAGGNPSNRTPLQGWNTGSHTKSSKWYLITQDSNDGWYM